VPVATKKIFCLEILGRPDQKVSPARSYKKQKRRRQAEKESS